MSQARITLTGTVESQPEKRFTSNSNIAVTNFTITVESPSRQYANGQPQPASSFPVKVTCWRQVADAAAEHLNVGDAVLVEGRLQVNSFQTAEGVAKKNYEVEASNIERMAGVPQSITNMGITPGTPAAAPQQGYAQPTPPAPQQAAPVGVAAQPAAPANPADLFTDDDIPF